ncbi:MAG: ankyrin repeat domain-containing protein [Parahaliea sp.]
MLQKAIQSRNFDQARKLITEGERLPKNLLSYQKKAIFDALVRGKAFDIVDLLIEEGTIESDLYEYDDFSESFFKSLIDHLDDDQASLDFLQYFLGRVDNINDEVGGVTFLELALLQEVNINIFQVMVDSGCQVDIVKSSNDNLIHKIIRQRSRQPEKALACLQLLFDKGVDINQGNINGDTPLHCAVREDRGIYLKWLLENGADANVCNDKGESAFSIAITHSASPSLYAVLCGYDSPDFGQSIQGRPPLLFEALKMMSDQNESSLHFFRQLLEDGADLYQVGSDIYGNEIDATDALVVREAGFLKVALDSDRLDVNQKDNQGNTLLHKFCQRETLHEERRAREVYRAVKYLLAAGADANAVNDREETPLMIASNDDLKVKTVQLLLSYT